MCLIIDADSRPSRSSGLSRTAVLSPRCRPKLRYCLMWNHHRWRGISPEAVGTTSMELAACIIKQLAMAPHNQWCNFIHTGNTSFWATLPENKYQTNVNLMLRDHIMTFDVQKANGLRLFNYNPLNIFWETAYNLYIINGRAPHAEETVPEVGCNLPHWCFISTVTGWLASDKNATETKCRRLARHFETHFQESEWV